MKNLILKTKKENTAGITSLLFGETIRPVHVNGSGKWSSNYRSTTSMNRIASLLGTGLFNYECGNDAPRGGAAGEFHKFTPKKKYRKLLADFTANKIEQDLVTASAIASDLKAKEDANKLIETEANILFAKISEVDNLFNVNGMNNQDKQAKQVADMKNLISHAGIENGVLRAPFWAVFKAVSAKIYNLKKA